MSYKFIQKATVRTINVYACSAVCPVIWRAFGVLLLVHLRAELIVKARLQTKRRAFISALMDAVA
jgi:hypothetical protein